MADRDIEVAPTEVPEIDETLETLLLQTLENAQDRYEKSGVLSPYTATLIGERVFEETYLGTTDECFAEAERTVEGMRGGRAYAFCYDGYLDTDEGQVDAIIVEGAIADGQDGIAIGLLYTEKDDTITFSEEPFYLGPAPSFLPVKVAKIEDDSMKAASEDEAEASEE